jgi:hypothetical protein
LISNGLGVALDVSQGGISFETPYSIETGLIVLATTDQENHLFKVKGKLLHSTETSNGLYHSGIKFIDIDWKVKAFIKKLIKEYNCQGYNLFIAIAKKSNNQINRNYRLFQTKLEMLVKKPDFSSSDSDFLNLVIVRFDGKFSTNYVR